MVTWRARHTAVQMKQSHFYGTPLDKLIGAFIVPSCGGLVITVVTIEVGMSSLPSLAISIFGGFCLLVSDEGIADQVDPLNSRSLK